MKTGTKRVKEFQHSQQGPTLVQRLQKAELTGPVAAGLRDSSSLKEVIE